MQKDKQGIVLGDIDTYILWGFKVKVKDRRDGSIHSGYVVEVGNEEYELNVAERSISNKYGRLGYDVIECEYDGEKRFIFNAVEIFRSLPEYQSGRVPEEIEEEYDSDEETAEDIAEAIEQEL